MPDELRWEKREIQKSYIQLRSINVGKQFISDNSLETGEYYSVLIDGIEDELTCKLWPDGIVSGLARLHRHYGLRAGDFVYVAFDGEQFRIRSDNAVRETDKTPSLSQANEGDQSAESIALGSVFARKNLAHIHIEPYSPGNLGNWEPQSESDVYIVLGAVSDFTDFRYCCSTSKSLLDRLGYSSCNGVKPDAILIDRSSDEYLVAELKMRSSAFTSNHHAEDIDVLVCWIDDATDRRKLPLRVLALKPLLETRIREGSLDL